MADPAARLNAALQGRYRIERELGAGGMATVYLADDLKHERKVALKVLKPDLAAVVGAERFVAEIKATALTCSTLTRRSHAEDPREGGFHAHRSFFPRSFRKHHLPGAVHLPGTRIREGIKEIESQSGKK